MHTRIGEGREGSDGTVLCVYQQRIEGKEKAIVKARERAWASEDGGRYGKQPLRTCQLDTKLFEASC